MAASVAAHLGIIVAALAATTFAEESGPAGANAAIEVMLVRAPVAPAAAKPAARETVPVPAKAAETAPVDQPKPVEKAALVERPRVAAKPVQRAPQAEPVPERAAAPSASAPAASVTASAASTPSAAASAAGAGGAGESSGDKDALVITNPRFRATPTPARYPKRARELGQEGEALVHARLDPDGDPEEVLIWKSSGFALLDNAALAAVRHWQFEPARRNGNPTVAWVEIPVRFQLN
jgi:protein TonB